MTIHRCGIRIEQGDMLIISLPKLSKLVKKEVTDIRILIGLIRILES